MRKIRNFFWPDADQHCHRVVFDTTSDMLPAIELCRKREVAIQAGGNVGVWPLALANRFVKVVTFEPDPENYRFLDLNVEGHPRIVSYCAALGEKPGMTGLRKDPKNIGAHYIAKGDDIQIMTIDGLMLERCDYICLDIEGYELPALKGARETIKEFLPVIQIEDKGLSDKYGSKKGDAEKWLEQFGYVVRHRIHRDVILSVETPK